MRVEGFEVGVWDVGFGVLGLGFRVWGLRFRVEGAVVDYRGTSLLRNSAPLGPYSRTIPRALWWP